jgi:hypothetical protein
MNRFPLTADLQKSDNPYLRGIAVEMKHYLDTLLAQIVPYLSVLDVMEVTQGTPPIWIAGPYPPRLSSAPGTQYGHLVCKNDDEKYCALWLRTDGTFFVYIDLGERTHIFLDNDSWQRFPFDRVVEGLQNIARKVRKKLSAFEKSDSEEAQTFRRVRDYLDTHCWQQSF